MIEVLVVTASAMPARPCLLLFRGFPFRNDFVILWVLIVGELGMRSNQFLFEKLLLNKVCFGFGFVIKLAGGLLFFLPFPYFVVVISLLYITLHYLGHYSLLYSTCVHFMVVGGDLFVTPPLWHPALVAVQTLS